MKTIITEEMRFRQRVVKYAIKHNSREVKHNIIYFSFTLLTYYGTILPPCFCDKNVLVVNLTYKLFFGTLITIMLTLYTIYYISKLSKKVFVNEKMRDFELQRIKSLLKSGQAEYVIELLDNTESERRSTK